ncbi:tetratricopeptide repeat protein [Tuwongella immobilis]|uniref:Uncharacterized protein n=1 Tax=Tuwongella immobilis TaxID=692036 RepID=A0A6C2YNP3_9BACT|nr:tetratricopeptide repeat protein [Tuwongella immobilis]VIP02819.1 transcriptional regulator : Uncharacterized protein OS=Isosphaera pallida (strain ATCC 43644 / DSM 9630 / IS1B) GN=Isop_1753 PE=4 SV=1: TPR_8: TPR_10 [Tuwongella immobilis]VTS02545.1 transcriptional regulator : Uncharacterized protein OS=Isosphaera pallida (strain ATCC 43644 / DSM 9630 / IS1B) GN=Isop_1753 PE=4 SV=1: TPR_8: TPR_10 [Tuwongella immobilis]
MAGFSPTMQQALDAIQRGETLLAERIMLDAVRAAESEFGSTDPRSAELRHELGLILLQLQQADHAVEAFAAVCQLPLPDDHEARRDRLTVFLNWGQALITANRLDEAATVLKTGADLRNRFYGHEHPGLAFGLEPLADVYLRLGRFVEALETIQQATHIYWKNGHPRVVSGLALHAEIVQANSPGAASFQGLESLPDELLVELAEAVFARYGVADPVQLRTVMQQLRELLSARLGATHPILHPTLSYLANLARDANDHAARIAAIGDALEVAQALDDRPVALHTLLGLALAFSDAGMLDDAEATYQTTHELARSWNDPAILSQVCRNYGLFHREWGDSDAAERLLQEAVEAGNRGEDALTAARAKIALGIFLQHARRNDEAKPLLESALASMDPAHPDALTAKSHLEAIELGRDWNADKLSRAACEAFAEYVRARLPEQLLKRIDVRLVADRFKTDLYLHREATPDEMTQINRAIEDAHQHFREQALQQD